MDKLTFWNKVNKYSLYSGVVLTPLLFLPFIRNTLDLPKRILVLMVVILGLGAWLIKQKIRGELRLRKMGKLSWGIVFLLGSFTLSTFFSMWKGLSFWGAPYSVADGLLSFLVLAGFSFLIFHSFKKEEHVGLIQLLIGSTALVGLIAILDLYGVSLGVGVSTLVGTFNAAAVFIAAVLPMALVLSFYSSKKLWLGVASLIMLTAVTVINFKTAWLVLIIGVLVSLFFSTWDVEKMSAGWVASLIGCLALALFFFLFRFSLPGFPIRPTEISLGLNSEYGIVRGVFNQGLKSKILGTGPATFIFEYSQHHSSLLNQTAFWNTRFRQGSSVFWDWLITKGILGVFSLLVLWGLALGKGFKEAMRTDQPYWEVKLGVLSSLVSLIGASFVFSFNFSLWFLFWVLLGLLGVLSYSEINRIEFDSKLTTSGYSLFLILIVLLGIGLVIVQDMRCYAAAQHKQGLRLSRRGKFERAIDRASSATQLNESLFNSPVDLYYRTLSQLYLKQALQVTTNKQRINPGLARSSIKKGVQALNKATEIAPFNPANWNVKGFFFRNLIGVKQAGKVSLKSYQKAAKLEPASPFAPTEIARVNILMAQQGSKNEQQAYQDASKALDQALKDKPDYAPAHYLKAVIHDQQGNLKEAINNLEKAEQTAGRDLGLTFQLGLLYWRNGNVDQAKTKFKQAIETNSGYANAHYMLGLVYDKQGEREKAKQQFKKVIELNPGNKKVKNILQNLKQGKSALEEVGTTTAPLRETPQEIKE